MFSKSTTLVTIFALAGSTVLMQTLSVRAVTLTSQSTEWSAIPAKNQNFEATNQVPSIVLTPPTTGAVATVSNSDATTASAEELFASYLTQMGVKMYGTYKCPNSLLQRQLFGKEAFRKVTYVECAVDGKNAQPGLCQSANIRWTPTWEINGHFYPGVRSLEQLARLSGYRGSVDFHHPTVPSIGSTPLK